MSVNALLQGCKRHTLLSVFSLIMLIILVNLGFWQLARAEDKESQAMQLAQRSSQASIAIGNIKSTSIDELMYRRVSANGHFETETFWLLDNQSLNGQAGYHVIVPLAIENSDASVLVNLGWLPADVDRQRLPEIKLTDKPLTVTGQIRDAPTNALFKRMTSDLSNAWPQRVLSIDTKAASDYLNRPVYPYIIAIDNHHPSSFDAMWLPPATTAEKHRGYALQWFAMALALVVAFVATVTSKRLNKELSED